MKEDVLIHQSRRFLNKQNFFACQKHLLSRAIGTEGEMGKKYDCKKRLNEWFLQAHFHIDSNFIQDFAFALYQNHFYQGLFQADCSLNRFFSFLLTLNQRKKTFLSSFFQNLMIPVFPMVHVFVLPLSVSSPSPPFPEKVSKKKLYPHIVCSLNGFETHPANHFGAGVYVSSCHHWGGMPRNRLNCSGSPVESNLG